MPVFGGIGIYCSLSISILISCYHQEVSSFEISSKNIKSPDNRHRRDATNRLTASNVGCQMKATHVRDYEGKGNMTGSGIVCRSGQPGSPM